MNQRSLTFPSPNGTLHVLDTPPVDPLNQDTLPMVLIHGMVGHAQFWNASLAAGIDQARTLAVDLRGHGDSTAPADADYTPAACASDIVALLNSLELDRVVLVGHSFGTLVALAIAAEQPERVANLILVDPPGDFTRLPTEVYEQELVPFLAALKTEEWRTGVVQAFETALVGSTPETQATILSRLASTPQDRILGMYNGIFAFHAVDALDRILSAPNTRASAILAPANTSPFSLHVLRPALPAIVLPNVGHWLILDAPVQFAAALNNSLSAT